MQLVTSLYPKLPSFFSPKEPKQVKFSTNFPDLTPTKTFSLTNKTLKIISPSGIEDTLISTHELLFNENIKEEDIEAYVALGGSLDTLLKEYEHSALQEARFIDRAGERLLLAARFYRLILSKGATHITSAEVTYWQIISFYALRFFGSDAATSIERRLILCISPQIDGAIRLGREETVLLLAKADKKQIKQLTLQCIRLEKPQLACKLIDLCLMSQADRDACLKAAILASDNQSVKALLLKGATLEALNQNSRIPLLLQLINAGDFMAFKAFTAAGLNINEKDKDEKTLIEYAISKGQYEIALWIAQHEKVNTDNFGNALIKLLCKFKDPKEQINPKANELFEELITHRSAVENLHSTYKSTPLLTACRIGLKPQTIRLLEKGASLSAAKNFGISPIDNAIFYRNYNFAHNLILTKSNMESDISSALYQLLKCFKAESERENPEAKKLFEELIKHESAVKGQELILSNTPLHLALTLNLTEHAHILLKNKASMIQPNLLGWTPFFIAIGNTTSNYYMEYVSSLITTEGAENLKSIILNLYATSENEPLENSILKLANTKVHCSHFKNILLYALLINDPLLFHATARCLKKVEYQEAVTKLKEHFPDASEHFFAGATIGINEAHYQSSDEIPHGESSATVQDLKKFCQEAKVNPKISTAINTLIDRIEKTTPFLGTPKADDQAALALWYEKLENLIKECLDLVKNDPTKKKILLVEIEKFIGLCGTGWFNNFVLLKNSFSKDPKDLPAQVKYIAAQFRLRLFQSYARNFTLAIMPHAIGEEAHVFNYLVKKYGKKYGIPGAQIIALNEDPLPLPEETRKLLDSIFEKYFQSQYTPTAVIDLIADDLKSGVPHDTFISWIRENAPDDIEVDAENIQIKTPKENIIDSINIQKDTIKRNFDQAIKNSTFSFNIIMRFLPPGTNLKENEWTSAEDKKTLLENLKANRLKDLEAREETLLSAIVDQEDVVAFLKKEKVDLAPITKKQAIREEQVAIFTQEMIYGENPRKGIIFFLEKLNILECFSHI